MRALKSEQERILNLALKASVGSQFLFAPSEYPKGTGTREPCDLAWACNGVLVLIYLKSRTGARALTEVKIQNLIVANQEQLSGWLRIWKSGQRNLTGENDFASLDIPYPGSSKIIAILVSPVAPDYVEYHWDLEEKLGLGLVATISQRCLEQMIERGANPIDFIHFLGALRSRDALVGVGDTPAARYLAAAGSFDKKTLIAVTTGGHRAELNLAMSLLLGMRHHAAEGAKFKAHAMAETRSGAGYWIMTDLMLPDVLRLAHQISLEIVSRNGGIQYSCPLRVPFKRAEILAAVISDARYLQQAQSHANTWIRANNRLPGAFLCINLAELGVTALYDAPTKPSTTELVLASIKEGSNVASSA